MTKVQGRRARPRAATGAEGVRIQRDLAVALGAVADLGTALEHCLDAIERVAGPVGCGLYLAEADGALVLRAHRALPAAFVAAVARIEEGSPLAAKARHGTPFFISTAQPLPTVEAVRQESGFRALGCLPIAHEGKVQAFLNVASRRHHVYPGAMRAALEAVAAQMGGALARLRAAEAVRRERDLLQTLLDNLPVAVFAKSAADGRYVLWSLGNERLGGIDAARALGKTTAEVWPEPLAAELVAADRAVLGAGAVATTEDDYEVPGRGTRTMRLTRVPVPDEAGKPRLLLGIVEDVTERRAAERRRTEVEEQLRHAQKLESVGRLAGGVAHDLNNLLSPVIGYADLLLAGLGVTDARRADLQSILGAAGRARDLTQQLLAFGRRQVLDMRVVDVGRLVRGFEGLLRRVVPEDVEFGTCLPVEPCLVQADPARLEQVLMNLVVNAADAMPEGGRLTLSVARAEVLEGARSMPDGARPGAYVTLSVRDTGHGMDEATLLRIFEPFYTTKDVGKGTGLGLATVYGIVRQHDGAVSVESRPARGACFTVWLPRVPGVEAAPEAPAPVASAAAQRGTEAVLVVEDDAEVRVLVRSILSRHGYDVVEAASGEAGLREAAGRAGPLHLLLTDVVLPGMDGRELHRRLSAERPGLRVLYMSGYAGEVIGRRGVLEPGMHFMQKPFSVEVLTSKVRQALLGSRDAPDGGSLP